jgi:signal transduction histidine kinase
MVLTQTRPTQQVPQPGTPSVAWQASTRLQERLARFATLTRRSADQSLETWGTDLLTELVYEVNGFQAVFYAVHKRQGKQVLVRGAVFAMSASDCPEVIGWGQGLAGQAAKSRRSFHLTNPEVIVQKPRTSLAHIQPNAVLIVPVQYENEVEGVVEITAMQPFAPEDRHFMDKLAEMLGANLRFSRIQEEMTNRLEHLVEERTEELQSTLENLKSAQMQIVQSEKMASLGQLIAGVAHEINTPIGAVKASAGNMQDALPVILNALPKVFQLLSPEETELFQALLHQSITSRGQHLSSREERQIRKQLTQTLEQRGVPDPDFVARKLVDSGIHTCEEAFTPLFAHSQYELLLDTFYQLGQLKINLDNITVAAEKTKRTVFALKTYVHKDTTDHPVPVDLKDNLEVILTLYLNQLKYGVDLQTDFEDGLQVLAIPDELGQIWTNLIHNALQAMNNQGNLSLTAHRVGDQAVVTITDDGPGIPPEIQQKIFEPFFTTKAKGEGTGLGLSIIREIIERYGGTIAVDSKPGETRFTVALPYYDAATK